jgi:hypothetical protein
LPPWRTRASPSVVAWDAEGVVDHEEGGFRDLSGEMNRRADHYARIVRMRREHRFDEPEWQAHDRTGNRDRRRDDGSGPVESVGTSADRLAIGGCPDRHVAVDRRGTYCRGL